MYHLRSHLLIRCGCALMDRGPFSSFSFQVFEDLCLDSRLFSSFKSHFYCVSIAVIIENFDQVFLRTSPQGGCTFTHLGIILYETIY